MLLVGAILTPDQRTVAAARRVMGRSDPQDYARYHEVLNRAVWSPGEAAHILLLLQHLDHSDGPLICGIRAFYQSRNPGTASLSSDQRSGHLPGRGAFQPQLRGQGQRSALDLSAVAGPGPWAGRHFLDPDGLLGALPVLTVLAPSAQYYHQPGTTSRDAATRSSPTGRGS